MKRFWNRHKGLLCIEIIVIFFCAILSFRPKILVFSADADSIAAKMDADGSSGYYQSEALALAPGVYQLQISGRDHEGTWYATVSAENTTFQALRCNGASAYPHQRELAFEAYVVDRIDRAYVSCTYIEESGQPVENISLYHTAIGWRQLAFVLLLAALGLDALVWLRESLKDSRLRKDQEMVFWVLGFSVLLAFLPYTTDYFWMGADGDFHLLRIEGLKETLLHRQQFPVRVQEYWLYGHGYAVSSFYGDLFLLLPALLRIVGFSLMDAYKMFVLAVLAATAVSAYYSFYQCTRNRYAALMGSVLYELAPYHIYNFYNRNAVGEYLGMMFLPLVLCGMYRIYTGKKEEPGFRRAKIPLIIGVSGILQSHLLTCEMTLVALVLAAVLMWRKTFRREVFRELFQAAVCCLLVNAWFWVPLCKMLSADSYALEDVVSRNIQSMGTRLAGMLQVYPYVGGGQTGMYDCEPIQIGAAFWLVLLCYMVLRLWRGLTDRRKEADNPYDRSVGFGAALSLFSLFLSTRYFPWDLAAEIPGIGMLARAIQFPTRLLAIATLFSAFTASFFALWLWEESRAWEEKERKAVTAGCLMAVTLAALWSALFHVNDISYNAKPVRLYTAENMGSIGVVNGEYLLRGTNVREIYSHDPVIEEGLSWKEYEKEGLTARLSIENPTEEELCVELPLTGYRGYGLDAEPGIRQPYIAEERGEHGDLRIMIPGGYQGKIQVSYRGFAVYRAAEGISLLAILAWMGVWVCRRHGKQQKGMRREVRYE